MLCCFRGPQGRTNGNRDCVPCVFLQRRRTRHTAFVLKVFVRRGFFLSCIRGPQGRTRGNRETNRILCVEGVCGMRLLSFLRAVPGASRSARLFASFSVAFLRTSGAHSWQQRRNRIKNGETALSERAHWGRGLTPRPVGKA